MSNGLFDSIIGDTFVQLWISYKNSNTKVFLGRNNVSLDIQIFCNSLFVVFLDYDVLVFNRTILLALAEIGFPM